MSKHARAPGNGEEFTICGLAEDAFETGDHDEPVKFAAFNERITCDDCNEFLDEIRTRFVKHGSSKCWKVNE